jgi:hypothetical protein
LKILPGGAIPLRTRASPAGILFAPAVNGACSQTHSRSQSLDRRG